MTEENARGSQGEPASDTNSARQNDQSLTGRQKLRLVFLVIIKRVRFLAIVAAVGMFLGYWDTVKLHFNRWTHPRSVEVRQVPAGKEFFCPMEPQVIRGSYEPNGDVPSCPICGMPLSLHDKAAGEELPPGVTGRVNLSPERVVMAGIKTITIGYRPMSRLTKSMGYVTCDESRVSRVVGRVEGYVEKLYVDKTFTRVGKGDPLAEIHSPQLYSAARELVLAAKGNTGSESTASARRKLLLLGVDADDIDHIVASGEAARNVTIRSPQSGYVMEKKAFVGASVEPKTTLFEIADLSRVWVEAEVYERDLAFLSLGQAVEVKVDAWPQRTFRGELVAIYPQVDMAMQTNRIRVHLDNAGGELRPGMYAHVLIETPLETIEFYKSLAIQPPPIPAKDGKSVGANSLVAIASAGVSPSPRPAPEKKEGLASSPRPAPEKKEGLASSPKPAPEKKEGLASSPKPAPEKKEGLASSPKPPSSPERKGKLFLVVPESAVIDTGDKKIVYIERAEGQYEGHEVELGPRHDGFFPVVKGLKAGNKVAAAGSFLVDAETRLNPAVASTYFGASGGQSLVVPSSGGQSTGIDWLKPGQPLPELSADQLKNVNQLIKVDCARAMMQRVCPVTGFPLGSMGVPVKMTLRGKTLFLCCRGCIAKARRSPVDTLKKLEIVLEIARQAAASGCG